MEQEAPFSGEENMSKRFILTAGGLLRLLPILVILVVAGCHDFFGQTGKAEDVTQTADADFERGPHRGRLLKEGSFAVEITIFETGVPPQFRVYPYVDGRPVNPAQVDLTIELERLGGTIDRFTFKSASDYLVGDGVVVEPHSFEVSVSATNDGRRYNWSYPSFEGRTTINAQTAREAGIKVEPVGPVEIEETLNVLGRVHLAPGAKATLRARFTGQVIAVNKTVGETVRAGECLLRIESNESLKAYCVVSPIDGVVLERRTNAGDIAGKDALLVVGDLKHLLADFHVFPKDRHRVAPGQVVTITSIDDRLTATTQIETILPTTNQQTQTVVAHVPLPNRDKKWMPGMTVRGKIVVKKQQVPLAVRTEALQRFRDFTVVFARVGETYEVRMLELGRRTPQWTQVLSGIRPGQQYVTRNSFLIKADIEKSGVSHDH